MMYRMILGAYIPGSWSLDEVECSISPIDGRIFTYAKPLAPPGPLSVKVQTEGEPLELTFAAWMVPIVTQQVGDVFERFARDAVQRLPVQVADLRDGYEVLNVVGVVDAVDRERSIYRLWKPEQERPDKLGSFYAFEHMVLKKDLPSGAHVFRIRDWEVAIVVSPRLKEALERVGVHGSLFHPIEQ